MSMSPKTSWQISNINGGTGATNVVPGMLKSYLTLDIHRQVLQTPQISLCKNIKQTSFKL